MNNNTAKLLLTVIIIHFCASISAQTKISHVQNYLVFTYEVAHQGLTGKEYHYWITPRDSINKESPFEVFPLYTQGYSKDVLERCIEGKAIDIFTYSTSTDFNFDNKYDMGIKKLISLITTNRVIIQSFSKKWNSSGQNRVDVKVYVTPIIGQFCHCLQTHGKVTYGFKGLVYFPEASFGYDKDFWIDQKEEFIRYLDYSYVPYSSYYPSSIHGNSNIRVKGSIEIF